MPRQFTILRGYADCWLIACLSVGSFAPPSTAFAQDQTLLWPSDIAAIAEKLLASSSEPHSSALRDMLRIPRATLLQLLPRLLTSSDLEVRLAAANAAGRVHARGLSHHVIDWLRSPEIRSRMAAALFLQKLPETVAQPALSRALRDTNSELQVVVAQALGHLGDPAALPALLGELNNRNGEVRMAIAWALARVGDPRAVVPLIALLSDVLPEVRRRAVVTLGELGEERAGVALLASLQDSSPAVRAATARSLGQLGVKQAMASLNGILDKEPSVQVRQAAIVALGKIGGQAAIQAVIRQVKATRRESDTALAVLAELGPDTLAPLQKCAEDSNTRTEAVAACVAGLGQVMSEKSRLLLEELLASGTRATTTALNSLGRVGNSESLTTTLQFIDSVDPLIRRASLSATEALLRRTRRGGTAVEPLVVALKRSVGQRHEQLVLLRLLGLTHSERARDSLIRYAKSTDGEIQIAVAEGLGLLTVNAEPQPLLRLLDSNHFAVAWAAAIALRKVGGATAVEPLLQRLRSGSPQRASTAALALNGAMSRGATNKQRELVLREIRSAPGKIADPLIEALGLTSGPAGLVPLVQLSDDPASATRAKVAEVLAHHGRGASETLRKLLTDPNHVVRANAVWSLGLIGNADDVEMVRAMMTDPHWSVSSNAVAAWGRLQTYSQQQSDPKHCDLLKDIRSHWLVNALTALSHTRTVCDATEVQWLLLHASSQWVRLSAARYLANVDLVTPTRRAQLFQRCTVADTSGRVALLCAKLGSTPASPTELAQFHGGERNNRHSSRSRLPLAITTVTDGQDQHPLPDTAFGLYESAGWIRNGWSDRRGSILAFDLKETETVRLLAPIFLAP